MINRLKLILDQTEYDALLGAALAELRTPADQARHILRQELIRRGLLTTEPAEKAASINEAARDA